MRTSIQEVDEVQKISDKTEIYEDVKIYDYGYKGFLKLREKDGITKEMIRDSLDPRKNYEQAKKAGESTGKSGSFFFFCKDKRFIIKTMFPQELDIFMQSIQDYFDHFEKNPDSLMARIYGVY